MECRQDVRCIANDEQAELDEIVSLLSHDGIAQEDDETQSVASLVPEADGMSVLFLMKLKV